MGAAGPVLVEGQFARNPWFLEMLWAATSGPVLVSASQTGTSVGAALLYAQNPPLASLYLQASPPRNSALNA